MERSLRNPTVQCKDQGPSQVLQVGEQEDVALLIELAWGDTQLRPERLRSTIGPDGMQRERMDPRGRRGQPAPVPERIARAEKGLKQGTNQLKPQLSSCWWQCTKLDPGSLRQRIDRRQR